jgi:hypothetical protein
MVRKKLVINSPIPLIRFQRFQQDKYSLKERTMQKKTIITLIVAPLVIAICTVFPTGSQSAPEKSSESQRMVPIQIGSERNPHVLNFAGKQLAGTARIWVQRGGHVHIDCNFDNRTTAEAFYSMYFTFYDSSGALIGSAGRTEIFPTQSGKSGRCGYEMQIPSGYIPAITQLQLTFYDSPQRIGM